MSLFTNTKDVHQRLAANQYIASDEIATVVYLAQSLSKPILAEGPAGVGKTELAKVWATALGRPLIRLQCYEGLDESKALYEWEYAKQMLYTQLSARHLARGVGGGTNPARSGATPLPRRQRLLLGGVFIATAAPHRPHVG